MTKALQLDDKKTLSFIKRHEQKLTRSSPVIWALRFDIILVAVVVFSIVFSLATIFWSGDLNKVPRYRYPNKAIILYFIFGFSTLMVAIFWVYSILNSLKLNYAPKLRRIKWSFAGHVSMLLLALPVILSQHPTILAIIQYNGSASRVEEYGVIAILFILGVASFLASFSVLARYFGFQSTLSGILLSIVIAAIFFLTGLMVNFLTNFSAIGPDDVEKTFWFIYVLAFLTVMALGSRALNGWKRYLFLYPVYYTTAAGFMYIALFTHLDRLNPENFNEVLLAQGLLLLIYFGSAIVTEIILQRVVVRKATIT